MRFHSLEAAIEHAVDHGYRPDDWQILEYLHDEFVDLTKVGRGEAESQLMSVSSRQL